MMNILNWTISGILIEKDKGNIEALNRIESFSNVNFFKEERGQYTKDVDERVKKFFLDTDIYFFNHTDPFLQQSIFPFFY